MSMRLIAQICACALMAWMMRNHITRPGPGVLASGPGRHLCLLGLVTVNRIGSTLRDSAAPI